MQQDGGSSNRVPCLGGMKQPQGGIVGAALNGMLAAEGILGKEGKA